MFDSLRARVGLITFLTFQTRNQDPTTTPVANLHARIRAISADSAHPSRGARTTRGSSRARACARATRPSSSPAAPASVRVCVPCAPAAGGCARYVPCWRVCSTVLAACVPSERSRAHAYSHAPNH